jgi:lipoate-protein ligase A
MAVDEAILEQAGSGRVPPTLRLYRWQPACLSLGYAQPSSDADREELARRGWELVRRPTGGRAILHIDELTYSVCGPQDEPRLAGSVLESYRILARALLEALRLLGLPAQAHPQATSAGSAASEAQNPVCFEVPSHYEITVDGKKLIGSAQARRKGGVLQHGSLPLSGDLARITSGLAFSSPQERQSAAARLLGRATTVEQILGASPAWEVLRQAFRQAFQEELNLEMVPGDLTAQEYQRANQLVEEKYANPDWTERS